MPVGRTTRSPGFTSASTVVTRSQPASPGWAYAGSGTSGSSRVRDTSSMGRNLPPYRLGTSLPTRPRKAACESEPAVSKSVLVTGANSGIGLVTVLELAAAGYDVVGTVRSAAKADLVQTAAEDRGVPGRTIEMDVNDADSCKQGITELADLTDGGPWAVVNNAGYAQAGAVEDIDDEL